MPERARALQMAPFKPADSAAPAVLDPVHNGEFDELQQSIGNQAVLRALSNGRGKPAASVILDDAAPTVAPGQMRRREFLAALEQAVSTAAGEGLSRVGRTAQDCPYLRYMFQFYGARDVDTLRRAVFRHAPETQGAATAAEYIAAMSARARHAADVWAATGRVEWQTREFAPSGDLRVLQTELGPGRPLDESVRAKAESAMQEDLSGVRVHTGDTAANMTRHFHARALTFGEDVAFAPGQYQPGTLIGDAIIAHELAHVVQQKTSGGEAPQQGESPALERDADQAAIGTVMAIWAAAKGAVTEGALKVKPALKTGLRLQGCKDEKKPLSIFSTTFTEDVDGSLVTSDAGTDLLVSTHNIKFAATVVATGGTDPEARAWEVGYIQTVFTANLKAEYLDAARSHNKFYQMSLPGPTRDGVTHLSEPPPWYNTADSLQGFAATETRLGVELLDIPNWRLPLQTPDGVGKLDSLSGTGTFGTWLIARQKSGVGLPMYLNYAWWDVDFGAKADFSSTGGSKLKRKDRGKGTKEPVLTGPIANDVGHWDWT